MRDLGSLDDYLVGELLPGLRLSVLGREYTVDPVPAAVGLWCQRLVGASDRIRRAADDRERTRLEAERDRIIESIPDGLTYSEWLIGKHLHQALVDDGVDGHRIAIITSTVMIWVTAGDDAAERFWRSGGRPEPQGPKNRAQRRETRSGNTGAASTTSTPASGSGTTSRRKHSQR